VIPNFQSQKTLDPAVEIDGLLRYTRSEYGTEHKKSDKGIQALLHIPHDPPSFAQCLQ
jgi:hypothetical protein